MLWDSIEQSMTDLIRRDVMHTILGGEEEGGRGSKDRKEGNHVEYRGLRQRE